MSRGQNSEGFDETEMVIGKCNQYVPVLPQKNPVCQSISRIMAMH